MPIPADHNKPVRMTAKESAFKLLQQWIIDGTLQPDEKLNDTELAKALNLSRTPVREALQLLEVQGFVEMQPGKATHVTRVPEGDIKNLLPPLSVLQALAGELAIPNLTHERIEELIETNRRFAEAIHSKDFFTALKIDEEFHQIIVDTADNPYITSMLSSLQAHVRRQFFHNSIILTTRSIEEHDRIIKALQNKDNESVADIMKTNWVRTIDEYYGQELQ